MKRQERGGDEKTHGRRAAAIIPQPAPYDADERDQQIGRERRIFMAHANQKKPGCRDEQHDRKQVENRCHSHILPAATFRHWR